MKRALSGWWDQVRLRDGWSEKIGKWPWFALQTLIPALVCLPLFLWIASFPGEDDFSIFPFFLMFPIMALFNIGRWNEDQKRLNAED